jgi:hypothetical protein
MNFTFLSTQGYCYTVTDTPHGTGSFLEADGHAAGQGIPRLFRNSKFCYCVHMSPPFD